MKCWVPNARLAAETVPNVSRSEPRWEGFKVHACPTPQPPPPLVYCLLPPHSPQRCLVRLQSKHPPPPTFPSHSRGHSIHHLFSPVTESDRPCWLTASFRGHTGSGGHSNPADCVRVGEGGSGGVLRRELGRVLRQVPLRGELCWRPAQVRTQQNKTNTHTHTLA